MSAQDDDVQNYALAAVLGIVGLVLAGVIGLAASRLHPHTPPLASMAANTAPVFGGVVHLYFEVGQDMLPPDATEVLAPVVEVARASGTANLVISGFHDASGDPAANADLAKRRAERVRHALEANGISPDHLVLSKPMVTIGPGDAKEARRVDVIVQ